ncbi:MAG: SusC/RagA family TonB-linked outer membrane protein, partial [Hymenobacter sp.]
MLHLLPWPPGRRLPGKVWLWPALGGALLLATGPPAQAAGAERPVAARAAYGPVTGQVTDEKGEGLPGVNVVLRGSTLGTQTDADGRFTLADIPDNAVLVFSFVGYASQEVPPNGRTTLSVQLLRDTKALSDVVVVGYGTQKRADVTGSVASLSGKEIKTLPVTNVAEALQGRLAGVEVVKGSGAPDAPASILIRGVSSLNNAPPLYIIDGVRQQGDNFNVQDIATIDVLKDASAASIYG